MITLTILIVLYRLLCTQFPSLPRVEAAQLLASIQGFLTTAFPRQKGTALKENGQGMIEYALIAVLIVVVIIVVATIMGPQIQAAYCDILEVLPHTGALPEYCMPPENSFQAMQQVAGAVINTLIELIVGV